MKRILKDYSTITSAHVKLIQKHYPEGFVPEELITISHPNGKYITCLEIIDEDTHYLFKIDQQMVDLLDDQTEDEFELGDVEDMIDEEFEDDDD
jgi:hypothetical protein